MSSHYRAACRLHCVAASALGSVALCRDCGTVHLNVQGATLRFDPGGFLELARLTSTARDLLFRMATRPPDDAAEPVADVSTDRTVLGVDDQLDRRASSAKATRDTTESSEIVEARPRPPGRLH